MATMQAVSRLRQTLSLTPSLSLGAWQMLPGVHLSKTLARCGYDWICVDTEHGNIDDSAMHDAVSVIAGCGVSPIVRVPANEGWMYKRALDAGAHGVVVPLLRSAEEARRMVEACKFPPQGTRGFGSPFPMASFGTFSQLDYLRQANEALVTIVQIETREALAEVEDIAKTPGVDVLFVGPLDLGNSIGYPIAGEMAPELKQAIAKILSAASSHGKSAGIYATSPEEAKQYMRQGFNMISVANDATTLAASMTNALNQVKS